MVKLEEIQVLNISSQYYEGQIKNVSPQVAFIKDFAMGVPIGSYLALNQFAKYCKANGDSFNPSDLIESSAFKAFSQYTLNACYGNGGIYKQVDGNKYFFVGFRIKESGFIGGAWLPFNDEIKALLDVKIISKEEHEKRVKENQYKATLSRLVAMGVPEDIAKATLAQAK